MFAERKVVKISPVIFWLWLATSFVGAVYSYYVHVDRNVNRTLSSYLHHRVMYNEKVIDAAAYGLAIEIYLAQHLAVEDAIKRMRAAKPKVKVDERRMANNSAPAVLTTTPRGL